MYVGEGMCVVISELYTKTLITEEEHDFLVRIIIFNKPKVGSILHTLSKLRVDKAYWWKLNRRGYIWRKIFLLGLIIKYSLKNE